MICTSCGEAIGDNNRFCPSCGAPHATASVSAAVPPPPSPSHEATPAASAHPHTAALDAGDMVDLGHRYASGIGVQKSVQEAARYYFEAARQGNAEGQFFLGLSLESGSGVYQSSEEALRWIRLSADQGYAPAQGTLGIYYRDGKGVPQSYTEALHWLQLAASQDATPALRFLGALYFYGRGTKRNPQEAIRLTRLAAEKNDADAQSQLAFFLSQIPGSAASAEEIPHWYLLAAEQGHVAAQASIGMYYEDGKGVPQSYAKAVHWYRMAAEKGSAIAQVCLAECYLTGRGVDTSLDEAERLFRAAASQDDPDGKRRLAQLLEARARAGRQTTPPQLPAATLIPSASPALIPSPAPAASPVAAHGAVLNAPDKTIAPNAPHIEPPNYGFTVKDEPGKISIYIPERKRPHKTVSQFGNGCAMAFVLVILVPIAGWIGYMAGNATGMVLGFGLMTGLIALLRMHEANRQKKIQAPFDPAFIIVDNQNIAINGKTYTRSHVREWTTRGTNTTGGSVGAVSQPSFAAEAMIGQQMQKKMVDHSYEVTFDYGNQQVRVVGGMTEAMAEALMKTITQALDRL